MQEKYVAKTFAGLEDVLKKEIEALGGKEAEAGVRSVSFKGDKELLYAANYYLRTAICILVPLAQFDIEDNDDLYDAIYDIDWTKHMSLKHTFAVSCSCNSKLFKHSNYPALLVKDALVDKFRETQGDRPNVDADDPDLEIDINISGGHCRLSINSTCQPLFKRGYRTGQHPAPINEILAAGMVAISNWKPGTPLMDPMCGSGTIIIEAAMKAYCVPAGLLREKYGFMAWPDFDQQLWDKVKTETRRWIGEPCKESGIIFGADSFRKNLELTRGSLQLLGLSAKVLLFSRDVIISRPPAESGTVVTNPPYGERLRSKNVAPFYISLGNSLRSYYGGWSVWMISPMGEHWGGLKLDYKERYRLVNGDLDCLFQKYVIAKGTGQQRTQEPQEQLGLRPQRIMRARRKKE
jgi:putative N6-adenine-specific DNA methylase